MNLDQMARGAARATNEAARGVPIVEIEELRTKRRGRILVSVIAVGIAAWVAVLLLGAPSGELVPPVGPTTSTTVETTPTTVPEITTTVPPETSTIDAEWVRGTHNQIIDDTGDVLFEFPAGTILYGRNTAWDGENGFVALTESGLIWMRPGETSTIRAPFGSIVDAVATEGGTHVVGVKSYEDQLVHWIELESGTEIVPPSELPTLDGVTFRVDTREVTIELPDWSDTDKDEAGRPLPPFDLPTLVVSEDGEEIFRIEVGSEQLPFVNIHDFDGRRLVIGAEPFEPALPPVTAWIVDLECATCTEKIETDSFQYFDLIGVLPPGGALEMPELP